MISPHLPPPSSNIKKHTQWQRIKIILLATFFGLWAGAAAACVIVGWFGPITGEAGTWAISYARTNKVTHDQLAENIQNELQRKMVGIYLNQNTLTPTVAYLSAKDKIGTGVVLSADGWIVVYAPAAKLDTVKNWKILSADNKMFNVDVVSKDSATGLLYVKVAQPGSAVWRPIEFAQDPKINDEVFVATNNWWQAVFLENIGYALFPEGHSDTILPIRWLISSARQSGSPVVSKQGGLVGITTEEGVLPAAVIEQQLSSVLARHVLSYASLGIEGWYSDEQSFFINSKFTPGFLVTKVTTKNSLLQKGDSIIAYNGRVVEPEKMWYTIQTTHSLNLTIMRDGKELQLTVVPTLVKN